MFRHIDLPRALAHTYPGVRWVCHQVDPHSPEQTLIEFDGAFPSDTVLQQVVDAYLALTPLERSLRPRLSKAPTTVTSVPALRAKVNEIIQLLADQGTTDL